MDTLDSILFPTTRLRLPREYALFLVLPRLHLLTPVEAVADVSGAEPADSFINSGFCQVHCPYPLGEKRERFLRLTRDLEQRSDEYAAQLSSLTLAAFSGFDRNATSQREIMDKVIDPERVRERQALEEEEERRWQARLLLAMGEILDAKEMDIASHMALLADDEAQLLKSLMGDDEPDQEDELLLLSQDYQEQENKLPVISRKRFKAWQYLAKASQAAKSSLYLAASPEAADYLLETLNCELGDLPFVTLVLPDILGRDVAESLEAVEGFVKKSQRQLQSIRQGLLALAQNTSSSPATHLPPELISDWDQAVAEAFPEDIHGRQQLRLYLVPSASLPTATESADDHGDLRPRLLGLLRRG